jgi:hypothetical protein
MDCMGEWLCGFRSQLSMVPGRRQATDTVPCASCAIAAILACSNVCVKAVEGMIARNSSKPAHLLIVIGVRNSQIRLLLANGTN